VIRFVRRHPELKEPSIIVKMWVHTWTSITERACWVTLFTVSFFSFDQKQWDDDL